MKSFADRAVAAVFQGYPAGLRRKLMALRELIFDVAGTVEGVGPLTETLKWGQPSYLTQESGSGSTVRIDRLKKGDGYAIYFHCQSGLVDEFRRLYPERSTTRASAPSCSMKASACPCVRSTIVSASR